MVNKYKSAEGGRRIQESYDALLKLWGVNVQEKDLRTAYGTTHVITAGDEASPPLLLFHGVGDDSALMWLVNAKALAERFHIIAVDTMGGPGKSVPDDEYFKSFDQAKWINSILDAEKLEKVYLAGVSNGAYLTQLYAAKRPERVLRAVCMSGSVAVKGMKNPMWRMMKVFLPEAIFPTERNVRKLIHKLCGDPAAIDSIAARHPEFLRHYTFLLKYFNNQSMFYHKIEGLDGGEIEAMRGKTRILIGACDVLSYGSGALEALKKANMNFRVVENAGHALNMEKPELANAEIIGFLLG